MRRDARRALAALTLLLVCCTKQQAKTAEDIAIPIAEDIACAIARAEQSDTAIAVACHIVPDIMPAVLVPLSVHRAKLAAAKIEDAGAKALALPCAP